MTDFKQTIIDFPKQFETGLNLGREIKLAQKPKNIIFCGMGGSIIPAKILLLYLDAAGLNLSSPQFSIHRDYDLPNQLAPGTLTICISWSGNTEETISSYQSARQEKLPLIALTKGGKLGELAQKDAVPLILLPEENIPARMAAGYMFSALYSVLAANGLIENETNRIENLRNLKPSDSDSKANQLSEKISNKTPLIYSSYKWRNLAAFWKIFFNENSKVHSFWNGFPSLAHQELAGFNEEDKDKFFIMLLKDEDDDPRHKKSIEKMNAILRERGYGHEFIEIEGREPLEKIFNNYLFAALTSMHLAQSRGVDPASSEIIDRFKGL